MMSLITLFVLFSISMVHGGPDWKVKITNNSPNPVVVKRSPPATYRRQCWKFEDFADSRQVAAGGNHIFYSMESEAIASGCSAPFNTHKYMWIEIKEVVMVTGRTPKSSNMLVERKDYKIPDPKRPGTQICPRLFEDYCPKAFKQGPYHQRQCNDRDARQDSYDVPQNLDITLFKGKLDGDKSGDTCYFAVDLKVGSFT